MLIDEQIKLIARKTGIIRTVPTIWLIDFARAIEREATATLIEQIKEDEALMLKALAILDCVASDANIDVRAFPTWLSVIPELRQRLEEKK